MKSIHNVKAVGNFDTLVNPHVKIQFEINSQPRCSNRILLVNPHVKIQFEINSQLVTIISTLDVLVNPHVKIQFEINSQQTAFNSAAFTCESSRKNTIWNQFTTRISKTRCIACESSRKNTIWNQFTTCSSI